MLTSFNSTSPLEQERLQARLGDLAVMDWPSLEAGLDEIARITAEALDVRRVSVWRHDDAREAIECVALWHDGTFVPDATIIRRETHPTYWAAIHAARTVAIDDARTSPALVEFRDDYVGPLGIGAMLDTSIRADGRTLGILCIEHVGGPRAWSPNERDFVASIGDRVALLLVLEERRRLEAALRQAQTMEAIGLLAGGVAHDFNNFLGVILQSAELLDAELPPTHAGREDVVAIRDAATRATALSRKLLRIGRREAMACDRLELGAVVRGFVQLASRLVPPTVTIRCSIAEEEAWILADATFIEQALLNLVANAVHAMADGGTLTIATGRRDVAGIASVDGAMQSGLHATITVRDTGTGMSAAQLARIFQPFFTTKGSDGTGLGLSVVYGGMRQHGGFVTVASAPGEGSTFTLHFPLLD